MVAPAIAASWHVAPASFGTVFGIGLFGGLIGVLALGTASDRFGRKPVLVAAIALFAGISLLTPLTSSLGGLIAVRFVAGLGMGERCPDSSRQPRSICRRPCGPTSPHSCTAASRWARCSQAWSRRKRCPGTVGRVFSMSAASFQARPASLVRVAGSRESGGFLAVRGERGRVERILARLKSGIRWNGRLGLLPDARRSPVAGLFAHGRARGGRCYCGSRCFSARCHCFSGELGYRWWPARRESTSTARSSRSPALNIGGVIGVPYHWQAGQPLCGAV